MREKQYKNINEVSKLLNIKEHVIRYWDSIDPKTQKLRFQGISTRTKGGTRFFNNDNIKKLEQIKNLLFENGKHNYSIDLANKIISSKKRKLINIENKSMTIKNQNISDVKLSNILSHLRNLEQL